MLATILHSKRATSMTFAIIETFAKVRELKQELLELHQEKDKEKQASKMQHFGETTEQREQSQARLYFAESRRSSTFVRF